MRVLHKISTDILLFNEAATFCRLTSSINKYQTIDLRMTCGRSMRSITDRAVEIGQYASAAVPNWGDSQFI